MGDYCFPPLDGLLPRPPPDLLPVVEGALAGLLPLPPFPPPDLAIFYLLVIEYTHALSLLIALAFHLFQNGIPSCMKCSVNILCGLLDLVISSPDSLSCNPVFPSRP